MAIVRLGTCGAVQRPARLGDLLIATHGSIAIHRNPDFWTLSMQGAAGNGSSSSGAAPSSSKSVQEGSSVADARPYRLCLPVPADQELGSLLVEEAAAAVGAGRVVQGLNASADSFYSSQVRPADRPDPLLPPPPTHTLRALC